MGPDRCSAAGDDSVDLEDGMEFDEEVLNLDTEEACVQFLAWAPVANTTLVYRAL